MKAFKRIAIKDWSITTERGDHFEIEAGKEYTTSDVRDKGDSGEYVVVFSTFWVQVPRDVFGEEATCIDDLLKNLRINR